MVISPFLAMNFGRREAADRAREGGVRDLDELLHREVESLVSCMVDAR